jgi:hypothetical protein
VGSDGSVANTVDTTSNDPVTPAQKDRGV